MNREKKIFVYFMLGLFLAWFSCSGLFYFLHRSKVAWSFILGGSVAVIPVAALFFICIVTPVKAEDTVRRFFHGEAVKWLVSAILFSWIFIKCDIIASAFFGAYLLMQIVVGFIPLIWTKNNIECD